MLTENFKDDINTINTTVLISLSLSPGYEGNVAYRRMRFDQTNSFYEKSSILPRERTSKD